MKSPRSTSASTYSSAHAQISFTYASNSSSYPETGSHTDTNSNPFAKAWGTSFYSNFTEFMKCSDSLETTGWCYHQLCFDLLRWGHVENEDFGFEFGDGICLVGVCLRFWCWFRRLFCLRLRLGVVRGCRFGLWLLWLFCLRLALICVGWFD